jgi:hypothetical protein
MMPLIDDSLDLTLPFWFYVKKIGLQNLSKQLSTQWEASLDLMAKSVIPILGEPDGRIKVIGSGFIVINRGKKFLVSAAHIFDERRKYPVGIQDGTSNLYSLKELSGNIYKTKSIDPSVRGTDDDDFGCIELPNGLSEKILQQWRPIYTTDSIDASEAVSNWYAAVGYRGRQKVYNGEVALRASVVTMSGSNESKYQALSLLKERHVILDMEGQVQSTEGLRMKNFTAEGMSGGVIWSLPTLQEHHLHNIAPRFVGMIVGKKNSFMHGTQAHVILKAIGEIF